MTKRGWSLFLAMCLIWGLPYLFIRIAVEDVSPAALVFLRTALAALVLLPIALVRREVGPVLARWRPLVVFAVIEIMIPWVLLGHAEQRISSSLAGLLVAAVPLFGALAFLVTSHAERFTLSQTGGLVLGFAGVASLVGLDVSHIDVLAVVEMLGVAICYAAGPLVLARSFSDVSGLGVMACALTLTAVVYAPFGLLDPPTDVPAKGWVSIVVLALVCTALAFVIFLELIKVAGPTRATIITYVNPAVAIALGVVLLDEKLTTGMLVGFPLILIGCAVAAGGSAPAEAVVAAPEPAADLALAVEGEPDPDAEPCPG
ncbi:DMT family transporter [Pimelobacter simplex]|uniref:DMT family transporter n=1 Tax=Nocardioides simplex TaxID=2045 RepID=UPI00214F680F|nr:DMT family transporter [Pimelobacter simplex]UUW89962.1 DMT family transporter [Pimelobacter simplex]UUW93791.1 DMT family transporter [Pimelobacter simplex]